MTDNVNEFAGEEFDAATTAYTTIDDIDGRLCLFLMTAQGEAKGNDGTPYTYLTGDVIVLDGETTEKVTGPFPFIIEEMRISASFVVGQLKGSLKTHRPKLGRVSSQPSSFNKKVLAYALKDPSPADIPAGRAGMAAYNTRQASADPFSNAA